MSELLCTICQHAYPCDKFLFHPCGHGFCEECTSKIRAKFKEVHGESKDKIEGHCPTCRKGWKKLEHFRIYLDFPEPDMSSRVLRHLECIGNGSSAIFVEGAGDMIRNLAEDTSVVTDRDKSAALLDAARRLEERVAPLMANLETMREEHGVLRRQLEIAQAQLKNKEELTTKINQLHHTVLEREAALATMQAELDHEKQRKKSEQDNNRRLTRSLRKKQDELSVKEREIENFKTQVHECNKQLGLMKIKLRALGKLTRSSRSTVHSPDDSLLVEAPLADIENAGNLKRSHRGETGSSRRPVSFTPSLPKRRKTDI